MRKLTLLAVVALAATLLAFTALPVQADTPGGTSANVAAWTGPGHITAYAGALYRLPGGSGGSGDLGGGNGLMAGCPGSNAQTGNPNPNLVPIWNMNNVPLKPGNLWVECGGIGASVTVCCTFFVFQIPFASLTPVLPIDLAKELQKTQHLPAPVIETNPPQGAPQLVNLPTWLWIEPAAWQDQVAGPAVIAGVEQITVTATPTSVTWTLPDGAPSTVVCNGPGTPYTPGATATDCFSQFHSAADATSVTAAITWTISYLAVGLINEAGSLPGQTTTDTVTVHVDQDQTVNAAS